MPEPAVATRIEGAPLVVDASRREFLEMLDETRRLAAPSLTADDLFKLNLALLRLYNKYDLALRQREQEPLDRTRAGRGVLHAEAEVRVAELKRDAEADVPDEEGLIRNLGWLHENGPTRALSDLQSLAPRLRAISYQLGELCEEAEQAIIWRASDDAQRWLEAWNLAGPPEQGWLITALIARILDRGRDQARGLTGGTVDTPANLLMSPEQQDALLEVLLGDDVSVRAEAIYALGEGGGADAVPALTQILGHADEPSRIRGGAAVALGRIGGEEAVFALLRAAQAGDDRWAVRYSINALRRLLPTGEAALTPVIRQTLDALANAQTTAPIARAIARAALADEIAPHN